MSDTKISALTELTALAADDELAAVDTSATTTKKVTTQTMRGNTIAQLTDAATIAIDAATSRNFYVTLGGNRTLGAMSNASSFPGQSGDIWVYQDGTGSRLLAYNAAYDFAGGTAPTLSTDANAVDLLSYTIDKDGNVTIVAPALDRKGA